VGGWELGRCKVGEKGGTINKIKESPTKEKKRGADWVLVKKKIHLESNAYKEGKESREGAGNYRVPRGDGRQHKKSEPICELGSKGAK